MAIERRVTRPNRKKASSKIVKWLVVIALVVSIVLSIVAAVGGWETIQGAKALLVAHVLLNVVFAAFVVIWNRGVLPVIIAFAMMYGIYAAVAAPQWFERDKPGLTSPTLDEPILGTLSIVLVIVQVVLIVLAAVGFQQGWNVEEIERVEVPDEDTDGGSSRGAPAPAGA